MGGRGTYAAGNKVPYTYETVSNIEGVKVLTKKDSRSSGSLPEEAHSSNAYIQVDKNGSFRRIRFYNEQHLPFFEIDYHTEKGLSKNGEPIVHVHDYSAPGIENRMKGRRASKEEISKYGKYMKGVDLS